MNMTRLLLAVICFTVFVSCGKAKVSVGAGVGDARTIQARGVNYVVPWETSDHDELPDKFRYKGESVSFNEIGGVLSVDGNSYGQVKAGDQVNLLTKGSVLINGVKREAVNSEPKP